METLFAHTNKDYYFISNHLINSHQLQVQDKILYVYLFSEIENYPDGNIQLALSTLMDTVELTKKEVETSLKRLMQFGAVESFQCTKQEICIHLLLLGEDGTHG